MDSNPLLETGPSLPLDRIRPEHVGPAFQVLIERTEAALAAIRAVSEPTFANSIEALERSTSELGTAYGSVSFLLSVNFSDELKAAMDAVTPAAIGLFTSITLDPDIWRVVRAFADTEEAASLTGMKKRLLTRTINEFRRNGAELEGAAKERLSELRTELVEHTNLFSSNTLRASNAWHLDLPDDSRLGGIPESVKSMALAAATEAGIDGYRLLLQAPIYRGILRHASDRALRQELWTAWNTRASSGEHDNRPVVDRILELRRELASLLGYDTFADYVLEDRMAATGATAIAFIDALEAEGRTIFERECALLEAHHAKTFDTPMCAWDAPKHAEDIRKARYDFDAEQLRPYFSFERVLQGLFDLAQQLFGVRVQPTELPRWHEDVSTWELVDGDRVLGRFYVDMFPRPTKRGGAWMSNLYTGTPTKDGLEPHLGAIAGNLTPASDGVPALLSHQEVETLFHEFGHLLHHLLSEVPYPSIAGTNVAWDFVELPSQIMQNWCWERAALDRFAQHWQTGEPIPDALFDAMLAARTYGGGQRLMTQMAYSQIDLRLHAQPDHVDDVVGLTRSLFERYTAGAITPDFVLITSFRHLFASPTAYAAGYYSYQWAEVLDADAFTRFADEGIFNPEVGAEFRAQVLSRGNSEDPAVLFKAFLGRDPNPGAHLSRYGL